MIKETGINIKEDINKASRNLLSKLLNVMDETAREGINDAKSHAAGKHPGGWGDVTSNLVNSLTSEVFKKEGTIEALLFSDREYAGELEGRKMKGEDETYSVLGYLVDKEDHRGVDLITLLDDKLEKVGIE